MVPLCGWKLVGNQKNEPEKKGKKKKEKKIKNLKSLFSLSLRIYPVLVVAKQKKKKKKKTLTIKMTNANPVGVQLAISKPGTFHPLKKRVPEYLY